MKTGTPRVPALHQDVINRALLEVAAGELQLLIIQIPIQHTKTTYASVYNSAWTLGNWPDLSVVALSYNDEVVRDKIGYPARSVMERCGLEVFDVEVDPRSSAATRWDLLGHRGGFYAASIHKAVAARTIDRLIVDDAVGSYAEVDTPKKRDYLWDKYRSEIRGRLSPRGAEIIIMSRWDPDDFVGRAIRDALERGLMFALIDMPAICPPVDSESVLSEVRRQIARDRHEVEPPAQPYVDPIGRKPGEALWPEERPLSYLLAKKATMTVPLFDAQYQMRARQEQGSFFKREWFSYYEHDQPTSRLLYYDKLPSGSEVPRSVPLASLVFMQYVDLALSESQDADFFVVTTVAVSPADKTIFVVHVYRARIPGPKHLECLWRQYRDWLPRKQKIEAVAYQGTLVQSAVAEGLPAFPIQRGRSDKKARAQYAAARLEQGRIKFPKRASWLAEWEDELVKFTGGSKGKDDQVDTLADAANDLLVEDYGVDSGASGAFIQAQ